MLAFSVGKLVAIDTSQTVPTPVEFGTLQDMSINFSWDAKELYGSLQFPRKVCRGKAKIEGKASAAEIRADLFNLVLAGTSATGSLVMTTDATATVPTTPFAVTVTQGVKFATDLGVIDVSDTSIAIPMKRGATASAAGIYSVEASTGKYTFNTADAGKKVQISYEYTASTTGTTITLGNPQMGTAPVFAVHAQTTLDGKQLYLKLNCCTSSKLDMSIKLEDFVIPSFDFAAFADSSGVPGYIYMSE